VDSTYKEFVIYKLRRKKTNAPTPEAISARLATKVTGNINSGPPLLGSAVAIEVVVAVAVEVGLAMDVALEVAIALGVAIALEVAIVVVV
jgi:hypothetical protein